MSDKVNKKRSRDELSDNEDEFSIASDQAVSYKQNAPQQFINIPSSVPPPHAHGEVSPLDGISGVDHTRLSPQALHEHDLRQPSLGFETYVRRQSTNAGDTDTVTTLTNSSNNPTPVKVRKRVKFTSNNMYNDDSVNIDNDNDNDDDNDNDKEVEDISNLFNIKLNTPPNSPASDDANVGGSRHRRKSSRVTRRKRKRINKSKTRKAKKNKKTRKSRSRKNKHYSKRRATSKNKRREK